VLFRSTIGIIYFYKRIFSWFNFTKNKLLKFFGASFAVTLSAQILIIPVCMYYFGKISVISFIANIFVVPAMGLLLYLSAAFYLFTFIFPFAASIVSFTLSIMAHIVLSLTVFFGNLSFASVDIAKPSAFQLFLFFAFIFSITSFKTNARFILGAILLFINLLYLAVPYYYNYGAVKFSVFDSKHITAIYSADKTGDYFTLYQKGKYYDKYFINAFKQFVKFKGIKKPGVSVAGFKETKDLEEFDLKVISPQYAL
jgi:competence protein ComEC